ncbi:unnamed protein product [Amoebophrya sp. A25]|nr:unnamed protein product [Amoebophrya sp. A25]|eukprot:GSA25T00007623001.1
MVDPNAAGMMGYAGWGVDQHAAWGGDYYWHQQHAQGTPMEGGDSKGNKDATKDKTDNKQGENSNIAGNGTDDASANNTQSDAEQMDAFAAAMNKAGAMGGGAPFAGFLGNGNMNGMFMMPAAASPYGAAPQWGQMAGAPGADMSSLFAAANMQQTSNMMFPVQPAGMFPAGSNGMMLPSTMAPQMDAFAAASMLQNYSAPTGTTETALTAGQEAPVTSKTNSKKSGKTASKKSAGGAESSAIDVPPGLTAPNTGGQVSKISSKEGRQQLQNQLWAMAATQAAAQQLQQQNYQLQHYLQASTFNPMYAMGHTPTFPQMQTAGTAFPSPAMMMGAQGAPSNPANMMTGNMMVPPPPPKEPPTSEDEESNQKVKKEKRHIHNFAKQEKTSKKANYKSKTGEESVDNLPCVYSSSTAVIFRGKSSTKSKDYAKDEMEHGVSKNSMSGKDSFYTAEQYYTAKGKGKASSYNKNFAAPQQGLQMFRRGSTGSPTMMGTRPGAPHPQVQLEALSVKVEDHIRSAADWAASMHPKPAYDPLSDASGCEDQDAGAYSGGPSKRERFYVRRNDGEGQEEVITSQKFLATFRVGIQNDQLFGAAKRIIGPGGRNMKLVASMIMGGKVRLRGEGFQEKDHHHPLQLNISCPTKEGYCLAKALVRRLLTQVATDYADYMAVKKHIVVRHNDHPMNPELPRNFETNFMRGYYEALVEKVVFVTTLPSSRVPTSSEEESAASEPRGTMMVMEATASKADGSQLTTSASGTDEEGKIDYTIKAQLKEAEADNVKKSSSKKSKASKTSTTVSDPAANIAPIKEEDAAASMKSAVECQ